jgi:hypothetical protein
VSTVRRASACNFRSTATGGGGGGGTAPAFVASSSNYGSNTVTKPSGLAIGDRLIIVGIDSSAAVTCAGFVSLGDYWMWAAPGTNYAHVLYRVIDGTEASTFTTAGSSSSAAWAAVAYRGGSGLPALVGGTAPTSTGNSIPSHLMAPVDGTAVHIYATAVGSSALAVTMPGGGVTTRASTSGGSFWGIGVGDEAVLAGTDATRTATQPGGAAELLALTFMLPTNNTLPAAIGGQIKSNGNSSNASITIPSYAVAGDLMVAAFGVTANTVSAGVSGWTAIDGPGSNPGGNYSTGYWWGYKVLTSGDIGATVNVTSGAQVWVAVGVLIRNPKTSAPIGVTGTMTHAASATAPFVAATSSGGIGRIAVSAVIASTDGNPTRTLNTNVLNGLIWRTHNAGGSNYGIAGLCVSGVVAGGASLAPTVSMGGGPSWECNTVLLDAA